GPTPSEQLGIAFNYSLDSQDGAHGELLQLCNLVFQNPHPCSPIIPADIVGDPPAVQSFFRREKNASRDLREILRLANCGSDSEGIDFHLGDKEPFTS